MPVLFIRRVCAGMRVVAGGVVMVMVVVGSGLGTGSGLGLPYGLRRGVGVEVLEDGFG